MSIPPNWRLPEGVNASLWQYVHTPRLAEEEDDYFLGHTLFEADAQALAERFVKPGTLVDLGCGSGRLSIDFAQRGFKVLSIDLSRSMLQTVGAKAASRSLTVHRVQANLCELGFLQDRSFDYALSMFSTLGMIRGRQARRRALVEAYRVLRPGGSLALHAHNLWLNLRDPQGQRWLFEQLGDWLRGRQEVGDRRMNYRGIPGMEVHLYRWSELRRELKSAGFLLEEVVPIDSVSAEPIRSPWFFPSFRAGGWIVFARRPTRHHLLH